MTYGPAPAASSNRPPIALGISAPQLRTVVAVLMVVAFILVAFQQGYAASQTEVMLLRRQVALLSSRSASIGAPRPTTLESRSDGTAVPSATNGDGKPNGVPRSPTPGTRRATAAPVVEIGDETTKHAVAVPRGPQREGSRVEDVKDDPDKAILNLVHGRDVVARLVTRFEKYPHYLLHHAHPDSDNIVVSSLNRAYPTFTMRATAEVPTGLETINSHPWSKNVWRAIEEAWEDPTNPALVPVMVIPLFHDAEEVRSLLGSIDAPVRLFAFSWNSDSDDVRKVVEVLKLIPYGVFVNHFPDNVGFSGAVNAGIRIARMCLKPAPNWYFIVNADTHFPKNVLPNFATQVNQLDSSHGLAYGPRQDHFAFVIMKQAVDTVGYFDEVFYPGYMEDIDYHWRVRTAGLQKRITNAPFQHRQSANDRKPRQVTGNYQDMLHRASRGWEYGWMKWGHYPPHLIERDRPPSGWRTPFRIEEARLSIWVIDPGQRKCVRTGNGQYHIRSSTCWYNGTRLRQLLPPDTELSQNLVVPGISGGG
jgi:hypothetical protein